MHSRQITRTNGTALAVPQNEGLCHKSCAKAHNTCLFGQRDYMQGTNRWKEAIEVKGKQLFLIRIRKVFNKIFLVTDNNKCVQQQYDMNRLHQSPLSCYFQRVMKLTKLDLVVKGSVPFCSHCSLSTTFHFYMSFYAWPVWHYVSLSLTWPLLSYWFFCKGKDS